jgi:hypothetical protein
MTQATVFPALTGDPVYFRTYSRFTSFGREQWENTVERMIDGLCKLGNLDERQESLLRRYALDLKAMPSGRWCWVGGTKWLEQPENFSGGYNCSNFSITSFERMAFMMSLSMMGVGTGTRLEREFVSQLPKITTKLNVEVVGEPGELLPVEHARIEYAESGVTIFVGDSREGWCKAYQLLLELSATDDLAETDVKIQLGHIRAAGAKIKGFGGVTNPVGLVRMFTAVAEILNRALGRQLTSVEVCLILDEVALAVVAGNVRRSANMRQFNSDDAAAAAAKDDMYRVDEHGVFSIDPAKDALRMGNHTLVFHTKPDLARCVEAVTKQWRSGEGAIMWAGESIARSNADILTTPEAKAKFLKLYGADRQLAREFLSGVPTDMENEAQKKEYDHRMTRCGINPCFAAGTMVLTSDGHFPIEELVGKTVNVWDGTVWRVVDNFRVTGQNQAVYKVTLVGGDSIVATANHSFILENYTREELCDLKIGDSLLKSFAPALDFPITNPQATPQAKTPIWNQIASINFSHTAEEVYCCTIPGSHAFTLSCGVLVGNCGEILGTNFMCNLSEVHLNQLDPLDPYEQLEAFEAAALEVAILLHHNFIDPEQRYSRELDPIVGVSFTGLFDFFVQAFGVDWLRWWQAGRPNKFDMSVAGFERCYEVADVLNIKLKDPFVVKTSEGGIYRTLEAAYLSLWREQVDKVVGEYCQANGLKTPNRCTTVQPSGTKSLLTGASPGWHPPKAATFLRRMTFRRNDPVALACIELGYSVIPSQADKDENNQLLDDPFDPRCTEWLVEIPIATSWADLDGVEEIDISKFSATAQFDFYMIVQEHYTRHNTSATIELREEEILPLATKIYESIQNDKGYISAALLQRFDTDFKSYPRLPFEPISKETYHRLVAEVAERNSGKTFAEALAKYDNGDLSAEVGPAGCDGDKCLIGDIKPSAPLADDINALFI